MRRLINEEVLYPMGLRKKGNQTFADHEEKVEAGQFNKNKVIQPI